MFFKKEKNCKMHRDLEELQNLTIALKQSEKEYNELKRERANIIKPFRDYTEYRNIYHYKFDLLAEKLSCFFLWGQDYGKLSPRGYFEELKNYLQDSRR